MKSLKPQPERVWERKISWNNHYSHIHTDKEETDKYIYIVRVGHIAVPGFNIGVHAVKCKNSKGTGYEFTHLSIVGGSKMHDVQFPKFYSAQYCVTLAKRIAGELEATND